MIVAKLPFEPIDWVKRWTHQGLTNPDGRDCGYSFIYLLAGMGIRQLFGRLFARKQPKGAGVGGLGSNPLGDIFADATDRAQRMTQSGKMF